jgi:DNA-binding IclR family transcriptional regulator
MEGGVHARAAGKLLLALAAPGIRAGYLANHPLEPLTDRTITSPAELDAEFDRIRERGYAIDEEEFAAGVACVAAPILVSGFPIGAYSVSVPFARFRERRVWLVDAVMSAAGAAASVAPPSAADAA